MFTFTHKPQTLSLKVVNIGWYCMLACKPSMSKSVWCSWIWKCSSIRGGGTSVEVTDLSLHFLSLQIGKTTQNHTNEESILHFILCLHHFISDYISVSDDIGKHYTEYPFSFHTVEPLPRLKPDLQASMLHLYLRLLFRGCYLIS